MGCCILLGGLLSSLLQRMGCLPGALLTSLTQRGNLPALLHHCGLQLSSGGMAGNQTRPRGIELRPVMLRAELDTASGAEANQQQAGQHDRDNAGRDHDSTALARSHNARRSAWPLSPPLTRRVMAANSPRSANSLRP